MNLRPLDPLESAVHLVVSRPAGLITDVDGTISPIERRPEVARVDPEARRALRRLVSRLEMVAAVSGRSVADLVQTVGVDGLTYVGNHGLEWWEGGRKIVAAEALPYLAAMAATMEWLRTSFHLSGVLVEDKGTTGAIHYRLSPEPESARRAIMEAVGRCAAAEGLQVREGRMVVEIRPPIRMDKGTAVERLVRQHELRSAIYLGDDVTDLDAFRVLRALRGSGECRALLLGVNSPEAPPDLASTTDFLLGGVGAAVEFLKELAKRLS